MPSAENPRRAIGYARVSSAEQALGSSLEDQQASIAAYAKARGLKVAQFFVESESGGRDKIERREQMQALLREARRGDLVLVDKLDRWSRDPEFTYRSVRELLERGASMFFVAEGIDPSTRDGDTHLNFRILFAREEHKRIRERTVGTRNLLRDRGFYVEGRTPFGYRRAHPKGFKGVEKNVLVVVPEEAALVRRMFRLAALGWSLARIANELELDKSRIHKSLRSRHYLGELRNARGEWMKGSHQALVAPDTFARANDLLRDRKLGGPRAKGQKAETWNWILRDVARCARCGAKMGAAYAGPKDARRYYYRCIHKCRSLGNRANNNAFVPVQKVESEFSELVLKQLQDLKVELARGPEPERIAKTPDFDGKRDALERRRARHIEAHAEGVITLSDLRAQLEKLDAERLKLNAAEAALGASARAADPSVRRDALIQLRALEHSWKQTDEPNKREIVAQLVRDVRISTDVLEPNWRAIDELIADLGA